MVVLQVLASITKHHSLYVRSHPNHFIQWSVIIGCNDQFKPSALYTSNKKIYGGQHLRTRRNSVGYLAGTCSVRYV